MLPKTSDNSENSASAWAEVAQRFRFAGVCVLVIGLSGWAAWFAPFDDLIDRSGTPFGGDYVMLYAAGQAVLTGESKTLYDDALNQQRTSRILPALAPNQSWPYRYPPTVAVCASLLAGIPFAASFAVFLGLQVGLLLFSVRVFTGLLPAAPHASRNRWMLAMMGTPVVLETLIGGQSSLLALACVAGYLLASANQRDGLAGMALALSLYKPNVLALFVLGSLVQRPRLLRSFLATAAAGGVLAVSVAGVEPLAEYLTLGSRLATSRWALETPLHKVHGLAPLFQTMFGTHGRLFAFACGAVLALAVATLRRRGCIGVNTATALLLLINALLNPYVPIYDLVLLIPTVVLMARAVHVGELACPSPRMATAALLLLFAGPHLSQAISQRTGLQPFPVVLLGLAATLASLHLASGRRSLMPTELPPGM